MSNLKLFKNQELEMEIETLIFNKTIYFNLNSVAKALDIVNPRKTSKDWSEVYKLKFTNKQLGNNSAVTNGYSRKLANFGETFLTEAGLNKMIFKSRKPNAEKVQDWVFAELLPSIRKNGFYISKEISDSQVQNLVQESLSIYENRKLFDLELKKLKSVIYGELFNQGATQKQIGGMFSNMFQNLHIATTKRTAGQIVFDEMKAQKRDLKIQTFNQLRKYPKEIKGDLLLAINYYSDDELIRFRGYLNSVITDVVQFIQSPHTTVTLSKLQFEIADSSQRKALKMTGYDIERFPRPLRKDVAKILDLLLVDGTDFEILETMENIRITYHNLQYK